MTAPDENPSTPPEKETPAHGAKELPGVAHPEATAADIADDAPDATEEQIAKDAAAQKRRQGEIEFLKWEELLEQLNILDPESKTQPVPNYWQSYILFTNSKLGGTHDNHKFVIPKVTEASERNNAVVFKELLDSVKLFTVIGSQHSFMASASETGAYDIGKKGIFFKAAINEATKEKNPFTQIEAKGIALLAMHNRDLLPPGSLKITGNPQQRAMIFVEIEKLNQLLPENARMIVRNAQDIDMKLVAQLRQAAASPAAPVTTETETPENSQGTFKTATEPRTFTPEEISTAQDNFSAKKPADATDNNVAIEEAADDDTASGLEDGKGAPSVAESQLQAVQELVDSFEREGESGILKHGKIAGETEDGQTAYTGRIRIEGARKGAFTHVVFTAPEEGERKIISIEKTDFYVGYTSPDIKLKTEPKDKLDGDFSVATTGNKATSSNATATDTPAPAPKGDEPRLTA